MFKKIVNTDVVIPSSFSHDAASCIRGLLTRNVGRRLGSGSDGAKVKANSTFTYSFSSMKYFFFMPGDSKLGILFID